jgi:hypothetical protein
MSDPAGHKPDLPTLCCDICGKPQEKARKFVRLAGVPKGGKGVLVTLCSDCIGLIVGVLAEQDPAWFAEQLEAVTKRRNAT